MSLQQKFKDAVLAEGLAIDEIITDAKELEFLSTDVYRSGDAPLIGVKANSVNSLAIAARVAFENDLVIIPRGGGASYSDGYVARGLQYVLIDLRELNSIVIDDTDATVTVGAGVTWAALKHALDSKGWRTPFWGPFSGVAATVGGSVSQHTVSHGSGSYGISASSVLGMDIVLANGEILTTGAAAGGGAGGVRHFGPDLTGLFTGDCGVLGLKASITMPLLKAKQAFRTASFSFQDFDSLHDGMRAGTLEGLDDQHFSLDAALSQGQIGKEKNAGRYSELIKSIIQSHGVKDGFAQLIKIAFGGTRALETAQYACHYIIEGATEAEAKAKLVRLRQIMKPFGAEIINTVPTVVRGLPFAPLFNTLGPKGERWVPLHGIMSHSATKEFHRALQQFFSNRAEQMRRLGVWSGTMFSSIGSSGFLYEIALYWPDCRSVYHEREVDAEYLQSLPVYEENMEARAYVDQLKNDLIKLYVEHGASFFQLGRAYPFKERLNPAAAELLETIKASLDKKSIMNAGALGIGLKS